MHAVNAVIHVGAMNWLSGPCALVVELYSG